MDLDAAEAMLDPRDRGEFPEEPAAKHMRSFLPVMHDPACWQDPSLPEWVRKTMSEGVHIRPTREPPFADQAPFLPMGVRGGALASDTGGRPPPIGGLT